MHSNTQVACERIPTASQTYTIVPTSDKPNDGYEDRNEDRIPTRLSIGVMSFICCSVSFMARTNISINMLAMIQPTPHANGTTVAMPDFGPRYTWTSTEQSMLLAAYPFGSLLAVLPMGVLIDRYGHVRETIAALFLLMGLVQFASPTVAAHSVGVLIGLGVLMGIAQSSTFASIHKLISAWAPPQELGKFMMYAMGLSVGTLMGWSIAGITIEWCGWPMSFYVTGLLVLVFTAMWWYFVHDTPASHPRIRPAERFFIESHLVGLSAEKSWPPMRQLLTSAPVWAVVLMQLGNMWGFYLIIAYGPRFINEVLGFSIASSGFLASLPYVLRSVTSLAIAFVADAARADGRISIMNTRRVFAVFSHIVPGLLLFALPFVGASKPYVCIALLSLAFGFNGTVTQTVFANIHDIAPNYSATVLALANTVGTMGGLFAPLAVQYYTSERSTIEEWRMVFGITAAMFIVPAAVFVVMGSGELLPWNAGECAERQVDDAEAAKDEDDGVEEEEPMDRNGL